MHRLSNNVAALFAIGLFLLESSAYAMEIPFPDVLKTAFKKGKAVTISHQWVAPDTLDDVELRALILDFFDRDGKLTLIQQAYEDSEVMDELFGYENETTLSKKFKRKRNRYRKQLEDNAKSFQDIKAKSARGELEIRYAHAPLKIILTAFVYDDETHVILTSLPVDWSNAKTYNANFLITGKEAIRRIRDDLSSLRLSPYVNSI